MVYGPPGCYHLVSSIRVFVEVMINAAAGPFVKQGSLLCIIGALHSPMGLVVHVSSFLLRWRCQRGWKVYVNLWFPRTTTPSVRIFNLSKCKDSFFFVAKSISTKECLLQGSID